MSEPVDYLSDAEIAACPAQSPPPGDSTPLEHARRHMLRAGHWHSGQQMGRRWAMGCVALEITQRCNLDCTLCYLSESAEAVKDIPLAEVCRRIDMIRAYYGPHTDVQVTGGEPTLRRRDELVAIVRKLRDAQLRPSLFTNGIKATRELLRELCGAGLVDVAFHVDMTQGRKSYACEGALNALRQEYVERARGLPLSVLFNTTVFDGNFDALPEVVAWFVRASDVVRLASFQLQADTGRGVLRERGAGITPQRVAEQICRGAHAELRFDTTAAGHHDCNRYAMTAVVNGRVYDLFDEPSFIRPILDRTAGVQFDRTRRDRVVKTLMVWLAANPHALAPVSAWLARKAWRMKSDLLRSRGRINKLSFFIHNFMDACHLERERVDACAFMVATAAGPMSMCLHNARRDQHVLQPLPVREGQVIRFWHPLTGRMEREKPAIGPVSLSRKTARGRARERVEEVRAPMSAKS